MEITNLLVLQKCIWGVAKTTCLVVPPFMTGCTCNNTTELGTGMQIWSKSRKSGSVRNAMDTSAQLCILHMWLAPLYLRWGVWVSLELKVYMNVVQEIQNWPKIQEQLRIKCSCWDWLRNLTMYSQYHLLGANLFLTQKYLLSNYYVHSCHLQSP